MNGMYNMFTVLNILAAQNKLKKNNVSEPPRNLIFGLLPGVPPVPQFLMTDAVVNNAITSKEKDDVEEQKRIVDQNNIQLTTDNAALTSANTELGNAIIPIVSASITIDSAGKVTDNAQSRALIDAAKQSPEFKKVILSSTTLSQVIRDFVDKGVPVVSSVGLFADTTNTPVPDPKKQKLPATS